MSLTAEPPSPMAILAAKSIELFGEKCAYVKGKDYRTEVAPLPKGKDLTGHEVSALTYLIQNGLELRMAKAGYAGFCEVFYQRRIDGPAGWTLSLTIHLTARRAGARRKPRRPSWPVPRRHRAI